MVKKLYILLLGLTLGVVCGSDFCQANTCRADVAVQSVVEASDREVLLCERECNSDMGVLRLAVDLTPATTPCQRTLSFPERLGIKCGVACGHDGIRVEFLARFRTNLLLSGADVADLYVYRLRRLII